MDAEDILDGLIRGALGSGRKRSRGALRVLGGGGSLINARTLLAAAGVAWGLYEASQKPTVPPPIPDARAGALPAHVLRLVRLTISAARADGDLSLEERGAILEHARDLGAEAVVAEELQTARPLAEIVAGASDPKLKADLYTLAFTLVRADENVSGAERIYLAQLAHQLGLDAPTAARLEGEAAARIDAEAAK